MSDLSSLTKYNNSIESLFRNKDFNNPSIKQYLKLAKIEIYSNANFENESHDYLIQACTSTMILVKFSELNLMYVLNTRNSKQYESAISNSKFFYENNIVSNQSDQYSKIIALNLLFLLSSNRNQQFYGKIQALTNSDLDNQYIKYVLSLNDAIEEGNYRKVFTLKQLDPLPDYFRPFLDQISETIRTEIAKSAEKAYSQISLKEALNIFQFGNIDQLIKFAKNYEQNLQERQVIWTFSEDKIIFERDSNKKINFNSEELIRTGLEYSIELQKIA